MAVVSGTALGFILTYVLVIGTGGDEGSPQQGFAQLGEVDWVGGTLMTGNRDRLSICIEDAGASITPSPTSPEPSAVVTPAPSDVVTPVPSGVVTPVQSDVVIPLPSDVPATGSTGAATPTPSFSPGPLATTPNSLNTQEPTVNATTDLEERSQGESTSAPSAAGEVSSAPVATSAETPSATPRSGSPSERAVAEAVLGIIPDLRQHFGWQRNHLDDPPPEVVIDCGGAPAVYTRIARGESPSLFETFGEFVTSPSYHRVQIYVISPAELERFGGESVFRLTSEERISDYDTWTSVTLGLYLTVEEAQDKAFLLKWVSRSLGFWQ